MNSTTSGMLRIFSAAAICGASSVFSLASTKAPPYSATSFSSTGFKLRQGAHHGAQQSSSTGTSSERSSTVWRKSASVTSKDSSGAD